MGRTKEFKDDVVLPKAMHLFWEKGYEGASLKDLLDGMGILTGSFYHAYGNKKSLFTSALKFYQEDFEKKRSALFNADATFQKKIRKLFSAVFDRQHDAVCPRGCFLFNSVSAETLKDIDLYKLVRRGIDEFEEFLEFEISKAVKNGDLQDTIDPKVSASILIAYMQGMMSLSVLDYDNVKFRRQTEHFLTSLGL